MYLSTFSKTVTSGLRTGWVVADPHVINRLAALRRMVDQQHQLTSAHRGTDLFNQTAAVADPDLVAEIKTEQLKFFSQGRVLLHQPVQRVAGIKQ